jgi:hypothetical protein
VNRGFSDRIMDVTKDESDFIYDYVNKIGTFPAITCIYKQ